MKKKSLILSSLSLAMLMSAGCNKTQPTNEYETIGNTNTSLTETTKEAVTNDWQKTKEATTNMLAHAKEDTTNAWANFKESLQSAADYSYSQKDAYLADANADVAALDQRLKQFSGNVANSSESVKADAQAKLQELNTKRAALGQKLDDVKNATEANWNEVKTSFKDSYDDLKNSLKQAWE